MQFHGDFGDEVDDISLQPGVDHAAIAAQEILDAVQTNALMALLGGVPRLVDLLHVGGGVVLGHDLVGHMDDAVIAPLEDIEVDAEGLVLVGPHLVDGVLQQIADDLVGFIHAGDNAAQVVLDVQMKLDAVLHGHGAEAEDQRADSGVLDGQNGVHLGGVLHQVVHIPAALVQVTLVDEPGQGLHVEVVVVPLGADHAHKGLHLIAVVLVHQGGQPLLPVGHQQTDAADGAPEQRPIAQEQGDGVGQGSGQCYHIAEGQLQQSHRRQDAPDINGADRGRLLAFGPVLLGESVAHRPADCQKRSEDHDEQSQRGDRRQKRLQRRRAVIQKGPEPHGEQQIHQPSPERWPLLQGQKNGQQEHGRQRQRHGDARQRKQNRQQGAERAGNAAVDGGLPRLHVGQQGHQRPGRGCAEKRIYVRHGTSLPRQTDWQIKPMSVYHICLLFTMI